MEGRKWGDLQTDCLVKVFEKVGLKGLATAVPLVCKSWHKSSVDPLCWKYIDFPYSIPSRELRLIVDCSGGTAIHVKFPNKCSLEDINYTAEKCPALESVCLQMCIQDCSSLVSKWKGLKYLSLDTTFYFEETLLQVSIHCKKLVGLTIGGKLEGQEALVIITLLPKIKYLKIRTWSNVSRGGLIAVLGGCRELEEVEACYCLGFDAHDNGILTSASRIKRFKTEGSRCSLNLLSEELGVPRKMLMDIRAEGSLPVYEDDFRQEAEEIKGLHAEAFMEEYEGDLEVARRCTIYGFANSFIEPVLRENVDYRV